jgi:uncharacterized protein YehS (DUF1456 family)
MMVSMSRTSSEFGDMPGEVWVSKGIMDYNDILRRLRYALDINNRDMMEIFRLGEHPVDLPGLKDLLKKEDEEGFAVCSNKVLGPFLDGFIILKRGRQEAAGGQARRPERQLTNNLILRKIRIALELKEDDMLGILKLANIALSRSELSAFFRDKEHKNFKACGDQVLRNFLNGLAVRYREKRS